jgi:hypothetical protein
MMLIDQFFETNFYSFGNPELKKAEAIKQPEFANRSNEIVLEKATPDREANLAVLEVVLYAKA